MYFSPLKQTSEKWESNNHTIQAANQNWEAITVFVAVFLQCWWRKYSSDSFVVIFFFSFYFLNALQSDNNSNSFCLQA